MSATRTAAIMSRPPLPAAAEIPTIRVTDADKAEIPAVDRKNGGEERPRLKAAEPTVDGGEVEEKPVGSCEFAAFGCTIKTPDHNAKRPVKHLTLLNDGVREEYKKANELVSGEDEMVLRFTKQKLVVNSIVCRDSSQLIWKIGDFANESRKAKLRLVEPLRSPTFYSEPFGYRMQAILAPYGNNDAFGDALSFYVQLLPGDYDPILRWPFDAKILFTLYDQNADVTRRLDFRYELVPNTDAINEAYVGRPFGADSNGILGVEAFVSLDQLYDGHYIAEDTIVVGVAVYD
ncbi:hypothetical protein M3Y99_01993300 [Aphelenchoides fujianensis]|nr:hypothetical protein M3Y99_01993300 [Aphelenchoides fujianensis]